MIDWVLASFPPIINKKALLRLAVLYNIPTVCNRSTADYLISSILFKSREYTPIQKDYSEFLD